MPVVLDLRAVGHRVAQTREDLDDLVLDQRDRMARTEVFGRSRAGQVLLRGPVVLGGVLQLLAQRVDPFRGFGLQAVELLSEFALHFGSDALELLHQGVQFAFLPRT